MIKLNAICLGNEDVEGCHEKLPEALENLTLEALNAMADAHVVLFNGDVVKNCFKQTFKVCHE